jgi:hypothetical protein
MNFSLSGKRGITKNENAAQLCSWWFIKFTQKSSGRGHGFPQRIMLLYICNTPEEHNNYKAKNLQHTQGSVDYPTRYKLCSSSSAQYTAHTRLARWGTILIV